MTGNNRKQQVSTGKDRTCQDRCQDRLGQVRTRQEMTGNNRKRQKMTGNGRKQQDRSGQVEIDQDRSKLTGKDRKQH